MKKDDIEKIYGELETFSKMPPKELWGNIEESLQPKEKKRRGVIWFWGSAAAILVVFLGYVLKESTETNNLPIKTVNGIEHSVDNDTINKSKVKTTEVAVEAFRDGSVEDSLHKEPIGKDGPFNAKTNPIQLSKSKKRLSSNNNGENQNPKEYDNKAIYKKEGTSNLNDNDYAQNIEKEERDKIVKKDVFALKQEKNEKVFIGEKENRISSNDSIVKLKDKTQLIDLEEELLAMHIEGNDTIITNVSGISKWSVEVLGGLSNTASESSIQGVPVNTTAQNDFIYAFKVGYAVTDRLVVKSGIGKNVLGQEISNILYVGSDSDLFVNDFQSFVNNQDIVFFSSEEVLTNDIATSFDNISEGTLEQQFNYIQVPLEFSYNLIRKQKYNVALGVGGNINLLTSNNTFLNNEDIGESIGASSTIFGATLNSNISYELAKKMILFIEPSYNYFEKPIENSSQNFSNTQLRVLFGLRYKL